LHDVIFHITFLSMDSTSSLITQIEQAAARLNVAPSTIGERAGQGGRFYARLKDGARVWPETDRKVRDWIAANVPEQGAA
jgi:hypothetical protein